jgi:hypothetical protein
MPDLIRRRGLLRTPGVDPIGGVPPIDRGLSAWRGYVHYGEFVQRRGSGGSGGSFRALRGMVCP